MIDELVYVYYNIVSINLTVEKAQWLQPARDATVIELSLLDHNDAIFLIDWQNLANRKGREEREENTSVNLRVLCVLCG